jgi:hypothetical protein
LKPLDIIKPSDIHVGMQVRIREDAFPESNEPADIWFHGKVGEVIEVGKYGEVSVQVEMDVAFCTDKEVEPV